MGWLTVLVVALVAGVRISAMNFPLERDEGEYAYAGQLILQGVPPYELAYNMKFPGVYVAYAVMMALFGQTPAGIHFGLMCLTTLTAGMLYWLGKKLFDTTGGFVAASCYAVLAVEPKMFGMAGHATQFVGFFVTAGLCGLWLARQRLDWRWAAASGVLFGTAVLMKQHAILFSLWLLVVLAADGWCNRSTPGARRFLNLTVAAGGVGLPFGICCLWLWHAGVSGKFWFWTIDYARQYVGVHPFQWHELKLSLGQVFSENILLWVMVFGGGAFVCLDRSLRSERSWLLGFTAAGLLATVPGFYFRTHYFLLVLPAAALLAGAGIVALRRRWNARMGGGKFQDWPVTTGYVVLLALTLLLDGKTWALLSQAQGDRALLAHKIYGADPFPEAEAAAKFIRDNTVPDTQIAVLGSEPEIYFLARRRSATGYLYTYPLMEAQAFARRMQDEMIREIETNAPGIVVLVRVPSSWLVLPASDQTIFDWWDTYRTNYVLIGFADMTTAGASGKESLSVSYAWGPQAMAAFGKTSTNGLAVFQRKIVP